jgi:hypothetical protein
MDFALSQQNDIWSRTVGGFPDRWTVPRSLAEPRLRRPARALDDRFEAEGLHPNVRCVCEDSALLKAVGRAGHELFPAPVTVAPEVCRQFGVALIGTVSPVTASTRSRPSVA